MLHVYSLVSPCAHLHRMVINDVPFRCLVNANPPLALPFKWQTHDIKRELIWQLQLIYWSFFRSNITPKSIIREWRRLGYLEQSRQHSLLLLGWIKLEKSKMLDGSLVFHTKDKAFCTQMSVKAKKENVFGWKSMRAFKKGVLVTFINGCFFSYGHFYVPAIINFSWKQFIPSHLFVLLFKMHFMNGFDFQIQTFNIKIWK